jgi:hypothetical protein
MKYQQERSEYQERLSKATTTSVGDVAKGKSSPSPAPQDFHGLLQLLSNYIQLLTVIIGPQSAHTRKVVAIWRKLRVMVNLFIDIGPREILFLLWAIFLDAREFLAQQVADGDKLPESQLRYTTNFLGVGRIPMDIMGVPTTQFGAGHPRSSEETEASTLSSGSRSNRMFRSADWVMPTNTAVSDDISVITQPMISKFPNATADALMAHSDLHYKDIWAGNKGACLNYNLLGQCSDKGCTYRHSKAQPSDERAKLVAEKLKPDIANFMAAGAPSTHSNRKRKRS